MGLSIDNLNLISAMETAIDQTAKRFLSRPVPTALHYYTKFPTAQSIIRSGSLWATCLATQEKDQAEMLDAIRMIRDKSDSLAGKNLPPLSKAIFQSVSKAMESRRSWIFIICFCDNGDSKFHWKTYGEYRFEIQSALLKSGGLNCGITNAQQWLQPVIYDPRTQKRLIAECFERIIEAQESGIQGDVGGPWMPALAETAARDIAQLLLRIAVSFKGKGFKDDREWRLAFCPKLALGHSAPTMLDEEFAVCIKQNKVRHIELKVSQSFDLLGLSKVPLSLFNQLAQSPKCDDKAERESLNSLLRENCSDQITCGRFERSVMKKVLNSIIHY